MIVEMLTAGVITAGSGRGFVVEGAGERLVITAAHCLPFLPPAQSFFEPKERILGPLIARLGDEPRAWAVCRFVDPIADIAVLGSPDNPHADEYKALMEKTTAFSIAGALRNPVNFWVPGRLLSLDGRRWFCCTVRHFGGPLWITHAAEGIRSEMSGSPIVTEIGTAIGVVCTAAAPWAGGPNPRLTHNLPGWLLRMPFMEARA
jgi:hypothetical protein